jgi:F-type H+-transporting ATPase subunit alpha
MDSVEKRKVVDFEAGLQAFAKTNHKSLLDGINAKPELNAEVEAGLKKCCEDFVASGTY